MRYALILALLSFLPQQAHAADVATCPLNKAVYKPNYPQSTADVTLEIQENPARLYPDDTTYYFMITVAANQTHQAYRMYLPYGCTASGHVSCNIRFPNERIGVTGLDKNFGAVVLGQDAPYAVAIPLLGNKIHYTPHDQLADFAKAEGRPEDKPVGSGLDLWIFDHCAE